MTATPQQVKLLLEHKALPDVEDNARKTPVVYAEEGEREALMATVGESGLVLVSAGASAGAFRACLSLLLALDDDYTRVEEYPEPGGV